MDSLGSPLLHLGRLIFTSSCLFLSPLLIIYDSGRFCFPCPYFMRKKFFSSLCTVCKLLAGWGVQSAMNSAPPGAVILRGDLLVVLEVVGMPFQPVSQLSSAHCPQT